MITEVGLAQDVGYQPDERRRIAVHEAGHAVHRRAGRPRRSRRLDPAPLERRSVSSPTTTARSATCARRRSCAISSSSPSPDRAAEIQEYGEASTGIASDLAAATNIAAQLIGLVGAGDSLLSLEAAEMPMAGNMAAKVLADERSRVQADEIMNKAADKSACMLLEHRSGAARRRRCAVRARRADRRPRSRDRRRGGQHRRADSAQRS